jgi:hypothetical protein
MTVFNGEGCQQQAITDPETPPDASLEHLDEHG